MINKIYVNLKKYFKENWKYLLIFFITVFICTYKLPFYIDSTGGLIDTSKRVSIEGAKEVKGSFNMAYVNEVQATIPLWFISLFNDNWDIVKEEEITYGDMTVDEVLEYGRISMREGAKDAVEIAYRKAGLEVTESNKKTVIVYRSSDADTDLKVGDVINSVDGNKVTDFNSLSSYLKKLKAGDKITLEVTKDNKKYTRYAKMIKIDGEVKIGIVLLETRDIETNPECTLSYKTAESGSSGGLMTALTIYNYLVKEDITGGKKIAGTGTIEKDGSVGEISGVKYKIAGAVKKHADIFLVPAGDNYEEAVKLKQENNYDIKIVKIDTFNNAVDYLESIM
jgi:PDZ domain-containing protein